VKEEEDWLWDRKPGFDSGRKKIIYISLIQILAYVVAYPASLLVVTGCRTVGA